MLRYRHKELRYHFYYLLVIFLIISSSVYSLNQTKIDEYKTLIEQYKKEDNKTELAKYLNKIAFLYWQIDALRDAKSYFEQSLVINEEIGNKNALRVIYGNLGIISLDLEEYQNAINYFEKSLKINELYKEKNNISSDLINIASALYELGYYSESNHKTLRALDIAKELNNLVLIKNCYNQLANNFKNLGNNEKANEYFQEYGSIVSYIQNQKMDKISSQKKEIEAEVKTKNLQLKSARDTIGNMLESYREVQLRYELLDKENQLKDLALSEQKAKEKIVQIIILSLIIFLIFIIVFLVFVYFQFRQKKKANLLLRERNEQIEKQKVEIEAQRDIANIQNRKIRDSILYAKRIQTAILPPEDFLESNLNDYFILYQPRDIVSGDFYWVTRKDNVLIIATADCTGHGVPGAFMSMLGVAFLNEIINKIVVNKHIRSLQADDILNQLRVNIITSLHQTGKREEPKDGMDIALCIIDFDNKSLQYAGAHNPVYIIRNNKIIQYDADKMPISHHIRMDVPFTKQEIKLQVDDRIYLFSDGFIDQFGGDQGLKYMSKRFKKILVDIHKLPMDEQKHRLIKELDEWKGKREQLDDILIFGYRYVPGTTKAVTTDQKYIWNNKHILIAEDTDINYFLLEQVLKKTNVNITRVKDGKEAVEFIKSNEVDLILMDINMPRMNGYDATKEIKKYRKDIPIIVQTAMSFENDENKALESGADDFISKPIDLKSFLEKIEKYIS